MRIILLFLAIALTCHAGAQADNKIVIGKVDSVYSNILNEKRKIWIYTPSITSGSADTNQRFPVLYVLDGDGHFASVAGLVQQLSQVNGNTVYPEMIIVAIPNTNRTRDLTPTHISSDLPFMDSNSSKNTDGGANFAAFIEKELIPHIDSAYPTQPYRTLIGHSFGGLMVMDMLTSHTKLFNAYIAIDPSMWYNKGHYLESVEKKLLEKKYNGTRLYIGIANTMPDGMTLQKMYKDTSTDTKHIRSIFKLDKFLKANPQNGLLYASKYYGDDNHSSVPLISEYDGLRFIFSYYRFNLTGKDFNDTTAALITKFKNHYNAVSKEMGFKTSPPELFINYLGYDAMANKHYAKAAASFEWNISNYPNSANVYDSYGDLFAAKMDTTNAIINYKKALAIHDNKDTKQKLDALEGKKFELDEAELQKYAGEYEFEEIPISVKMVFKEHALWAEVSNGESYELVPFATDTFTLKNMSGYKVEFKMDGNKAAALTSYQPNGTFKAHIKN